MTTPINSELNVAVSILDTDVAAIKAEGFPKYPASVARFNHTQVPYKNVYQPYSALEAYDTQTIDTDIPDWLKELIAHSDDLSPGVQPLLVRESHNSRFFYLDIEVTTA